MTVEEKTWFGQPRGLAVLCFTQMWEQFSYFGMRAILVYYMTKEIGFAQGRASLIYGLYTAFVYLTPIFGGMVADRWLGRRSAIVIGGSIMALGHFMMAFEPLFFLALGTIAVGNGLFLPSLPSQIGDLYRTDDPRRGWAYNVYYVGVNVGGFLAPLVCGTLGELYGWHVGFGAAGIGMLIGLVVYLAGGRYLPPERWEQAPDPQPAAATSVRKAVLLLLGVGLAVTVFRGAYEQVGNTVALFAEGVDRKVGSLTIPMTWFQALNPMLVFLMTPPLLAAWRRRAARGREASPMRKMAMGAAIVGAAYLLLAGVSQASGSAGVHWLWLALFFVVLTFGELYILPTGLGLFVRLAPPGRGATTVAAWCLAIFGGSLIAGVVGALWSRMDHAAFFVILTAIAWTAALALLALDHREARA